MDMNLDLEIVKKIVLLQSAEDVFRLSMGPNIASSPSDHRKGGRESWGERRKSDQTGMIYMID